MAKVGHRATIISGGLVACLASIASVFAPSVPVLDLTAGLFTGETFTLSTCPISVAQEPVDFLQQNQIFDVIIKKAIILSKI